jgi:hypothetical protein
MLHIIYFAPRAPEFTLLSLLLGPFHHVIEHPIQPYSQSQPQLHLMSNFAREDILHSLAQLFKLGTRRFVLDLDQPTFQLFDESRSMISKLLSLLLIRFHFLIKYVAL